MSRLPTWAQTVLQRLRRDALVHFVVLGGLLFVLTSLFGSTRSLGASSTITIEPQLVQALEEQYRTRFGHPPDAETRDGLVNQFVREEALVREARSLMLDRGDPIIRRRLVQKLEFLLKNQSARPPPRDEDLQGWLHEHAEQYRVRATISLEHRFFGRDARHGHAEEDARQALAPLQALAPSALPSEEPQSDPFVRGVQFQHQTQEQLSAIFGPEFAVALASILSAPEASSRPQGQWFGPVESSYGFHLLRITEIRAARAPTLEDVRPQVTRDFVAAQSDADLEAATREVLDRYQVEEP